MAVLLTRSEEENRRLAAALDAEAVAHMSWPLSRIDMFNDPVTVPDDVEALVFTSANGVRAFARLSEIRNFPAFCVGDRTSMLARETGFRDVRRAGRTVEELARTLAGQECRQLFYARARDVAADLGALLSDGFRLNEQVVYAATSAGPPESSVAAALADGRISAVMIWSRRNAEVLAEYLTKPSQSLGPATKLVAISENAAQPLSGAGFCKIHIADVPDSDGMLAAVFAALRQV